MTVKTSAEQQLEFLKKLKEQQQSGKLKPRPPVAVAPSSGQAAQGSVSLTKAVVRRAKKRRSPGLPLGLEAWKRLRDEGIKSGKIKLNKALGDWAVELLLNMPSGLEALSSTSKKELFAQIQEWSVSRGLK
jgi:hypothetical protein